MQGGTQSAVKWLLLLLIAALMVVYPFVVYHFIDTLSPRFFVSVILFLFLIRFMLIVKSAKVVDYLMLGLVTLFCAAVMILDNEQGLKFYPVLMNVGIGFGFIVSLSGDQSTIERIAKAGKKKPPPEATPYLRKLSLAWGVLLIFNGVVSAYTAWYASLSIWALYNGFLSYLLIAVFAISEYLYRGYYKRKNGIVDD